jgi:putative nucleotidyltransferase with HDIG domain
MLPEREFKDVLDGILSCCQEKIGARKAALYLAGEEATSAFDLVSQFGHASSPPSRLDPSDMFVGQLLRKRSAFFVNGSPNELGYMELLGRASERQLRERLPILLVPLYRGRIVGYFEMQEKADRGAFTQSDLEEAKKIAAAVVDSLAHRGLYGLNPSATVEDDKPNVVPLRVERRKEKRRREFSATAMQAIEQAKAVVARETRSAPVQPSRLTEEQISAVKSVLSAILTLPGSSLASLISYGPSGHVQLMTARSSVTNAALESFHARVAAWLRKRREDATIPKPVVEKPFGDSGPVIQPAHIATVLSAQVSSRGIPGIVLSVAFENAPEPRTHRQLEIFLHEIERALEQAASVRDLQLTRRSIAEKLLEPDFESYPELRAHCREVASLAERFARELGLSATDRENLVLAALVHDVGLRTLDYRHLASEPNLPEEDLQIMHEHPVVGAAMVASVLGWPTANIVLAHQERFDGSGYPYGLQADRIPMTARLLHVCDAFVAMTLGKPHRQSRSREEALLEIERGEGTQFDPELGSRFRAMVARDMPA